MKTPQRFIDLHNQIMTAQNGEKSLLLHSCCGPCSSSVIEYLADRFKITVYYLNNNIYPFEEYTKRLNEQKRLCRELGIAVIDGEYDHGDFLCYASEMANEKEGGARCRKCIADRMRKTAIKAKNDGFDFFATTLSVSPHKDAVFINEEGERLQNEIGIDFLFADFKKNDGYLRSIRLSEKYGLYRQNYCGCEFSQREDEK